MLINPYLFIYLIVKEENNTQIVKEESNTQIVKQESNTQINNEESNTQISNDYLVQGVIRGRLFRRSWLVSVKLS